MIEWTMPESQPLDIPTLDDLVRQDFSALSEADALNHLAWLIDLSADAGHADGTSLVFERLDALAARNPSPCPTTQATIHYFRSNAWHNRILEEAAQQSWDWEQPSRQNQILQLRRAVRHPAYQELIPLLRWRIRTNLGSQLNEVGRTVDAIQNWDTALADQPRFGKAAGARGQGLVAYAIALQSERYTKPLLVEAQRSLSTALEPGAIHEEDIETVTAVFKADLAWIEETLKGFDDSGHEEPGELAKFGDTPEEMAYRRWCVAERLFLNPLNDLGDYPLAAEDSITLPPITESSASARPPAIIGFYNQMKQEYVSARFMLFEGLHSTEAHYSDKHVALFNTLDYPSYGFGIERIRMSFRSAYSVLDKIAFFLNAYLQLGHKHHLVSFRSVWYEGAKPDKPLLQRFHTHSNWPLRGLFWLSKEFFEDDFKQVTEPDAEELALLRNQLEHRYLQLHSMGHGGDDSNALYPGLRRSMGRHDFEGKTLRLFRYTRSALIYLSMAVRREEAMRSTDSGIVMPMILDTWEDEWKE